METLRLFIAVDPPEEMREEIRRVVAVARTRLPGFRWPPPENGHITLRFLGEMAAAEVEAVEVGLTALAAVWSPLTLQLTGWGVFPAPRQARVVWLGVGGETAALAAMARASHALPAAGPPEARAYQPHLTLARSRQEVPVDAAALLRLPFPDTPWRVDTVRLYASTLTREGARYRVVRACPLAGVSG